METLLNFIDSTLVGKIIFYAVIWLIGGFILERGYRSFKGW
jgi:hypothetical protein